VDCFAAAPKAPPAKLVSKRSALCTCHLPLLSAGDEEAAADFWADPAPAKARFLTARGAPSGGLRRISLRAIAQRRRLSTAHLAGRL